MPHLWPTSSSSGWPPSITARYFSSCPSDSTSRWTPCPPGTTSGDSRSALVCFRLSPSCPFRPLHTFHSSRPARNYPRFWIRRSSFERQRDLNPPDQRAAQRILWPLLTSPAPSRPVARAVVRYSGQSQRPLEVRRAFFSRTRRIYPHGVPNDYRASPSLAG